MADSIDTAQEADQAIREALLSRRKRKRSLPGRDMAAGISPTHCLGCGDAIPPERRQAVPGTALCADCAADHERRTRQQRGIS